MSSQNAEYDRVGPQTPPLGHQTFLGSEDDCYRFIAAVAWPLEREENRDAWAVTMRNRPELLAQEVERARARLDACVARVYPPGKAADQ